MHLAAAPQGKWGVCWISPELMASAAHELLLAPQKGSLGHSTSSQLRELYLTWNGSLGHRGPALGQMLQQCDKLQVLDLHVCGLTAASIESLCRAAAVHPSLLSLNLSDNFLGDAGAKYVAGMLRPSRHTCTRCTWLRTTWSRGMLGARCRRGSESLPRDPRSAAQSGARACRSWLRLCAAVFSLRVLLLRHCGVTASAIESLFRRSVSDTHTLPPTASSGPFALRRPGGICLEEHPSGPPV